MDRSAPLCNPGAAVESGAVGGFLWTSNELMPKTPKRTESDDQLDPVETQRRMDDAVRRMLSSKPETHEEMVARKHRKGEIRPKPKR